PGGRQHGCGSFDIFETVGGATAAQTRTSEPLATGRVFAVASTTIPGVPQRFCLMLHLVLLSFLDVGGHVPSKVCGECHHEIYAKFSRTAMGRSLSMANQQ